MDKNVNIVKRKFLAKSVTNHNAGMVKVTPANKECGNGNWQLIACYYSYSLIKNA